MRSGIYCNCYNRKRGNSRIHAPGWIGFGTGTCNGPIDSVEDDFNDLFTLDSTNDDCRCTSECIAEGYGGGDCSPKCEAVNFMRICLSYLLSPSPDSICANWARHLHLLQVVQ